MALKFEKIHKVTIECIKEPKIDNQKIKLIGSWYYKYLESSLTDVTLSLPFHDEEVTKASFVYLRYFTIIYKLFNAPKSFNIEETCLFDIFKFYKNENLPVDSYKLNYTGSQNNILKWGDNTFTKEDEFFPIFLPSQIHTTGQLTSIYNSFAIFKAIKNSNLINYPVLIDLNNLTLTLKNDKHFKLDDLIIFLDENLESSNSPEEIEEKENILNKLDITLQLLLRYPYHRNIHTWLIKDGRAKFELCFNSRFYYDFKSIMSSDLFLLPREISSPNLKKWVDPTDLFLVLDSNHNQTIYDLFLELKAAWKQCDFNIYTTPFPKYWFMFINPILGIEEWVQLFEKNYPAVRFKPIMNTIRELIKELHSLNWVVKYIESLNEDVYFVFPELKGNKSKRLKVAYNHFENYIRSLNEKILFKAEIEEGSSKKAVLINGFDIIYCVNQMQRFEATDSLCFLIPDFIYFMYNPWLLFQSVNYQSQVLMTDVRMQLSPEADLVKNQIEEALSEIKVVAISRIKWYKHQYMISTGGVNEENPEPLVEDIELDSDEEHAKRNVNRNNAHLTINKSCCVILTTADIVLTIGNQETIYLYNTSILKIEDVERVSEGDLFFTSSDLAMLAKRNGFFEKLSDLPDNIKDFQYKLLNIPNAYDKLKQMGLDYVGGRTYFNSHYCIDVRDASNPSFQLPRKRQFWKIICDFLGVESEVMSLAFISYYGRTKKSRIKQLFQDVFEFLINNDLVGRVHDPETVSEVAKIVKKYQDIFQQVEDLDLLEISQSILETLGNELMSIVQEVKSIKIIDK